MTFPTLQFEPSELATGQPKQTTIDRACELFTTHGALRLHDVFPRDFLEQLKAHIYERYKRELGGTTKQDRRPLFSIDLIGPPGQPAYYANPMLLPILRRILGDDFVIGAVSTVISFPGAPQQFVHRDSASLFGDFAVDIGLPTYALTILAPMVDANIETGSTRVWPGTHRIADFDAAQRMPSESPDVPFGSILMTDSRVVHCGSPNVSTRVRPLIYTSYHRNWFRDWGGYEHRVSVRIGRSERRNVPTEYAHMFRIADESIGEPEGPQSLIERVRNAVGL